jgi:flagellar hook-associated protein 3 FlgL
MRISDSGIYRNFATDLQSLNEMLNRISRQVATGKRLTQLGDSPAGSAELVSLTDLASQIDQYRSSSNTVSYFLKASDSALNEVNNLLTSVYSKASQAGTDTVGDDQLVSLAAEIRSLRDQMLSLANSQAGGRYLFAGSMVTTAPFILEGDTVTYQGDGEINSVRIDEGTEVEPGLPGSEAFGAAFAVIESVLTAIDSGDRSAIGTALNQFASAMSDVGQARGKIGAGLSLIENAEARLDVRETSLKERRSGIKDADMVAAIVQLNQAQTALQTAISAGGSILPQRNLFDILG